MPGYGIVPRNVKRKMSDLNLLYVKCAYNRKLEEENTKRMLRECKAEEDQNDLYRMLLLHWCGEEVAVVSPVAVSTEKYHHYYWKQQRDNMFKTLLRVWAKNDEPGTCSRFAVTEWTYEDLTMWQPISNSRNCAHRHPNFWFGKFPIWEKCLYTQWGTEKQRDTLKLFFRSCQLKIRKPRAIHRMITYFYRDKALDH